MDFKNTLIILTSNVGSSVIEKGGGGIGFQVCLRGGSVEAASQTACARLNGSQHVCFVRLA